MSEQRKNVMKEFRIDEISAVDKPAQAPAIATIMKRAKKEMDEDDMPEDEEAMSEKERKRMKKEQEDAGVPDSADSSNNNSGDPADSVGNVHKDDSMSDQNDQTVEKAVHDEQVAELTKRAERAEQIADLSDAHRGVFKSLEGEQADEFLAMTAEQRDAEVSKAADADPVVYTSLAGEDFRKSDDQRLVAMAKRADETERKLVAKEAEAKAADLQKRANELEHLPGDADARLALVKAVDSLEGDDRAKAEEILKAADSGLSKAFERAGTRNVATPGGAEAKLEQLAKRIQSEESGLSYAKAYDRALDTPEGRQFYREMRSNG